MYILHIHTCLSFIASIFRFKILICFILCFLFYPLCLLWFFCSISFVFVFNLRNCFFFPGFCYLKINLLVVKPFFSVQFLHFYLVIFFQRIECISCQKYEDQIFISSMPMFMCVWVCDFYLLLSFVVCLHFFLSLYDCQNSYFLTTYYQMSWILQDKLFGWIRKLRGGGGMEAYYLHGLWNQRTVTVCDAIETDSFTQIQPLYFFKPNHINEGFF